MIQVVIVLIFYKNDDSKAMLDKAHEIKDQLTEAGIRCKVDDSDTHNPGFKFNAWEVKGVPLRFELGAKDFANDEVRVAVRHDGRKFQMKWDSIAEETHKTLELLHHEIYEKALKTRDEHLKEVDNWKDFMEALDGRNICLAPWCDVKKCEEKIKDQSKEESIAKMAEANEDETLLTGAAKTLCIPYELGNQKLAEGVKCFYCGEQAKVTALWGRSY